MLERRLPPLTSEPTAAEHNKQLERNYYISNKIFLLAQLIQKQFLSEKEDLRRSAKSNENSNSLRTNSSPRERVLFVHSTKSKLKGQNYVVFHYKISSVTTNKLKFVTLLEHYFKYNTRKLK